MGAGLCCNEKCSQFCYCRGLNEYQHRFEGHRRYGALYNNATQNLAPQVMVTKGNAKTQTIRIGLWCRVC